MTDHFYEIEVVDHSRLGGPMGSDSSTPTLTRRFVRRAEEIEHSFIILGRKHRVSVALLPIMPALNHMYDFGHVGMIVRKCEFS